MPGEPIVDDMGRALAMYMRRWRELPAELRTSRNTPTDELPD
jgi:hypothetical protein